MEKNIEAVKESVLDHFFVFDLPKDFNTKESIGVELPPEVHRYNKKFSTLNLLKTGSESKKSQLAG